MYPWFSAVLVIFVATHLNATPQCPRFDLAGKDWRRTEGKWSDLPVVSLLKKHRGPVRHLTIHNTGVRKTSKSLKKKLRGVTYFSKHKITRFKKRLWGDLPYHRYIDAKGMVGEGRNQKYQPDTNTRYDTDGHITVAVEGRDDAGSSAGQMDALTDTLACLAFRHNLNEMHIGAHKDHAHTSCPGDHIMKKLPEIRRIVRRKLAELQKGASPNTNPK